MRTWNELSMAEKADIMKLAIEGGVYDLDSIRSGYNEYANGGKIHIKPSHRGRLTELKKRTDKSEAELYNDGNPAHKKMVVFARNARKWKHGDGGWLESLATTASKKVMDYIQAFPANPFTYDWQNANGDGTAQDTYLLPRKLQKREFLRKGYIKGKDKDYGLVKKAVGDRNLPVYQTAPDAITRDKLILLGNDGYYVAEHDLEHPGAHPLATYTDGHGNFYQKAWDLNDYGGEGGSTESIAGKLLDMVGSPVVVTTGYQKIKEHPWQVGALKGMMSKKGLVPTEIDGKTEWTLPEITVVGKRKKHGLGGNLFELGGPQRSRMPAHPKNREKDPDAYDAYQKWQSEMQERQRQQEEQNKIYAEEKVKRNAEAAEELNRRKSVVMSALSDTANSVPVTGSEIAEAAEAQRQEKLDKAHKLKMGLDATMTAAELLAAGYGVTRGLTHLNRYMARQATQSTGQAISRDAMRNLANWNRRVARIDKPQVLMNGIGGTADAYQWYTADNNFDAWENGLETGANAAGVVGGMNWFRNLPYLRRIGGNKIDAVLDGLGYGAAAWDVVKNIPPLSTALENKREESR